MTKKIDKNLIKVLKDLEKILQKKGAEGKVVLSIILSAITKYFEYSPIDMAVALGLATKKEAEEVGKEVHGE